MVDLAQRRLHHVEHVMGTVFSFDIRDLPTRQVREALNQAITWLHSVDEVFSTYRTDSAITRLDRGEITLADCPPDVADVLDLCGEVSDLSGGWFSAEASGRLDPSGLVKGWAIEHASRLLADAGARNTCVNGGGDIRVRGEPEPGEPWCIGIAHPLRDGELCTVVRGRELAIATSGTAERGGHILDRHTGLAAQGPASITVIGSDLTRVDAYATAASAMGDTAHAWIERLCGYEAFAVVTLDRTWATSGFGARCSTGVGLRPAPSVGSRQ
ncbi:FAD:protein FMN transferase [Embleya sp. NPDC020630]|uniref:FAD:protein FMN transferase n=1 Tax=Embleya sp. NPDC020630 TaxID=3363979 RepID=UPI0037B09024